MGGVHHRVAVPALPTRHPVHLGPMHDGQLVDVMRPPGLLRLADSHRDPRDLAAVAQKLVGLITGLV